MLHTYLEYNTVVRLCHFVVVEGKLILYEFSCSIRIFFFFLFWQEIVFCVMYVLNVQYSCAVVLVFCCGGKVILYKYLTVTIVSQKYRELSL